MKTDEWIATAVTSVASSVALQIGRRLTRDELQMVVDQVMARISDRRANAASTLKLQ